MKISKNKPLEKAKKFCSEHKPMIIGTALGITGGLILLFKTMKNEDDIVDDGTSVLISNLVFKRYDLPIPEDLKLNVTDFWDEDGHGLAKAIITDVGNTEELAKIIDSLEEVAKDTCNTNGPINAIIEWMPD